MQMSEKVSYVVTDPKGTIVIECGKMLKDGGYKIKVLNTINFKKSMHYNPFQYIRSEKGYSETGEYNYSQYEVEREKNLPKILGQSRKASVLCTDWIHLL